MLGRLGTVHLGPSLLLLGQERESYFTITGRIRKGDDIIGLFRVKLSFFDRVDRGACVTHVTMPTARYLTLGKFF
jgi:hypothetical protein